MGLLSVVAGLVMPVPVPRSVCCGSAGGGLRLWLLREGKPGDREGEGDREQHHPALESHSLRPPSLTLDAWPPVSPAPGPIRGVAPDGAQCTEGCSTTGRCTDAMETEPGTPRVDTLAADPSPKGGRTVRPLSPDSSTGH